MMNKNNINGSNTIAIKVITQTTNPCLSHICNNFRRGNIKNVSNEINSQ